MVWSANCQNDIAHISFEICFVTIWMGLFRKRFVFREMMSLADDISCYLNEAWMKGVYHLAESFGTRAIARTLIGFAGEDGHIAFFEGVVSGTIVSPRGTDGFGWDPLFQPDGQQRTFAEMTPVEKHRFSMRRLAIEELRKHLEQEAMERFFIAWISSSALFSLRRRLQCVA